MRRAAFVALSLCLAIPCLASRLGREPGGEWGVTPGGLVWARQGDRIGIFSAAGEERLRFRMAPDERAVLSVADDGARVTSPWPSGVQASMMGRSLPRLCRLVFRDASGRVLRTAEPEGLESEPGAHGLDVYFVRREGADLVLLRASAAEPETPVAKIARQKLLRETGKVESLTVHATQAGVVVDVRGPYRSAYLLADGSLVLPDPAIDCGYREEAAVVYPGPSRTVERVRRDRRGLTLERLSREGRLLASVAIAEQGTPLPVPGAGLLVVRGSEAALVDERGGLVQRLMLTLQQGAPGAARRLSTALEAYRASPSGASWAELALVSSTGDYERLSGLAGDLDGALGRLLQVSDGHADAERASAVVVRLFASAPYLGGDPRGTRADQGKTHERVRERATAFARHVDELGASAPAWFQRAAAPWVLAERRGDSAPWVFDAVARALEAGETVTPEVPPELMTRELAETVALHDRARLDADDRRRGGRDEPRGRGVPSGEDEPGFHVPAARFPDLLFDCLAGAPPTRLRAVVTALMESRAALGAALAVPRIDPRTGEPYGEPERPAPEREAELVEGVGRVGTLLDTAARSEDPETRVAAHLVGPLFGRPVDAARFRADVLSRPELADLGVAALLVDRSLDSGAWTRLFRDAVANARGRSRDPLACADLARAFGEEDDGPRDPYCAVLGVVMAGSYSGDWEMMDSPAPARAAELRELTRARTSPPELRLSGQLARAYSGEAAAAELLELWNEPQLPVETRLYLLQAAEYGTGDGVATLADLSPELLRQLRSGRLSRQEEDGAARLAAKAEPAELARLAVERLLAGRLKLADSSAADTWLGPIEIDAVTRDARLHAALEKLLDDEVAGPRAAALLAKAGEPKALPRLKLALETGCFG